MENKKEDSNGCTWVLMLAFFVFFFLIGKKSESFGGSYTKPYHTRTGKLVKGHPRKSYSTSATANKSRINSKSYHNRHPHREKLQHPKP